MTRRTETRTSREPGREQRPALKQEGDELADRAAGAKNKRLEESIASRRYGRSRRAADSRGAETTSTPRRSAERRRKVLARLLARDRRQPVHAAAVRRAWRTSTVVQLAQGIFEERALRPHADPGERAARRRLRRGGGVASLPRDGVGAKEPVQHIRGCWVIELALSRYEPLRRPTRQAAPPTRPRDPFDDLDLGLPFDMGGDRLRLRWEA